MGRMDETRIRSRMDMRTQTHIAENRAFDNEIQFWYESLNILPPGGTMSDIA
jgi:hypothetical protein